VGKWIKSVGVLRLNNKTKDRSPDLIGSVKIHSQLIHRLLDELDETGEDVVECNIAAWQYRNKDGSPLLNLQLSERYESPQRDQGSETIFDVLQKRQDEERD
jgi:hypothetical protein